MRLHVLLGGEFGMFVGVDVMRVGKMCVVSGPEVIACFMVLGGFRVVVRSQSVMMGGLFVMMRCLLRHRESPFLLAGSVGRKHEEFLVTRDLIWVTADSIKNEYALNEERVAAWVARKGAAGFLATAICAMPVYTGISRIC